MENKITIIEGPPPVFERINDGWAMGMNESPVLYDTIFTQVRTFNGPSLVERCHGAWKKGSAIFLHFKNDLGVEEKLPIVAARSVDTKEGQVLLLWVRQLPSLEDLKILAEDFEDDLDLDEADFDFEDDEEDFDEYDDDEEFDDDEELDSDYDDEEYDDEDDTSFLN